MTLHFETIELKELALKLNSARLVLIVDDEVRIADTLAAILTHSGFKTMVAYDAASALEIAGSGVRSVELGESAGRRTRKAV